MDDLKQADFRAKKAQLQNQLELMQKPIALNLSVPDLQTKIKRIAKFLPKATGLLESLKRSGDSLLKVTDKLKIASDPTASSAFGILGLVFASWNFVRIPFVYFLAILMNEEPPITLKNDLKFIYAGLALTLAVIAFSIPVTAPFIALFGASIGIGMSLYALGKTFYNAHKLRNELIEVQATLSQEEQVLKKQMAAIGVLESRLATVNEADLETLSMDVSTLQKELKQQNEKLEALKIAELELKAKINKKEGKTKDPIHIAQKLLAIVLSLLVLVGLIVSLYFPPIGAGILLGVAVFSTSVAAMKFLGPPLVSSIVWVYEKLQAKPNLKPQEALTKTAMKTLGKADAAPLHAQPQERAEEHVEDRGVHYEPLFKSAESETPEIPAERKQNSTGVKRV